MTHTKGPWKIFYRGSVADIETLPASGLVHCVASVYARGELQESNARLIAAAPDMLESLEWLSDQLHKAANGGFTAAGEKWTVGKLKHLIRNYREVCETAILKAREGIDRNSPPILASAGLHSCEIATKSEPIVSTYVREEQR